MANNDDIIVRAYDFKMLPDVELYVEMLSKKGTLEKLSKENDLNVEAIRDMPLGKMCDIFTGDAGKRLEPGDIIIFGKTATMEVYTGGI